MKPHVSPFVLLHGTRHRIFGFAKCHSVRIGSSADGHQSPPGFSQARVNGENITRTPKLSLGSILSHVKSSYLCHKIKLQYKYIYTYTCIKYSQIISKMYVYINIYIYIYSDTQIIQSSHYTTAESIPVYDPTSTLERQWDVKHAKEMKHVTVLF